MSNREKERDDPASLCLHVRQELRELDALYDQGGGRHYYHHPLERTGMTGDDDDDGYIHGPKMVQTWGIASVARPSVARSAAVPRVEDGVGLREYR
jgi:hypothetical protein